MRQDESVNQFCQRFDDLIREHEMCGTKPLDESGKKAMFHQAVLDNSPFVRISEVILNALNEDMTLNDVPHNGNDPNCPSRNNPRDGYVPANSNQTRSENGKFLIRGKFGQSRGSFRGKGSRGGTTGGRGGRVREKKVPQIPTPVREKRQSQERDRLRLAEVVNEVDGTQKASNKIDAYSCIAGIGTFDEILHQSTTIADRHHKKSRIESKSFRRFREKESV
ncbi:hypothetical protein QAD02_014226 [Eretmocerus hayati]|uniref:Uncharacterized protein n=1 Tax=Eretmocerus hayati TaxID=131215 RepID=A0ACC2P759_9HYME|nr:hypothetical protein QAD02_014226 [Eretmocerus hayati]